jgi:hypothetical protein
MVKQLPRSIQDSTWRQNDNCQMGIYAIMALLLRYIGHNVSNHCLKFERYGV